MKSIGKRMQFQRWKALLYKDLCDLRWNGQVLSNLIIGVILVSLSALFLKGDIPISFIIAFIFGMLTMVMQGNLIVEEQEQQTILRLKQVGFSLKEIILSKMLITVMTTAFILIIFFILNGKGFFFSLKIFILSLPMMVIMLVVGTFLGMKTKNTIEVSLYGIPIILLYFFTEGLLMNSKQGDMPWLVIFPNYHLHYGIHKLYFNEPFLSYLAVPVIWMAAVIAVFIKSYKRLNFD